jgi:hypothetical protein
MLHTTGASWTAGAVGRRATLRSRRGSSAAFHEDEVREIEINPLAFEPAKLVPLMPARFMETDLVFTRARRAKSCDG